MLLLAKLTQTDYINRAKTSGVAQFLTIPFSHYVEFGRWCLDSSGMTYEEIAFAPVAHVLPLLKLRVSGTDKHLSNSSYVKPVLKPGQDYSPDKEKADIRRATAVPVLVLPTGIVATDSWSIANLVMKAPISPQLKIVLDEELGPLSRQLAYHYLFSPNNIHIAEDLFLSIGNWFYKVCWWLFLKRATISMMQKMFKVLDTEAVEICRGKLRAVFEKLDVVILNKRGKYIDGDTIGVSDIAIAALCAPVVAPREYCGGRFVTYFDRMERQDKEYQRSLAEWRGTVTGQYVLRLYKEDRGGTVGGFE